MAETCSPRQIAKDLLEGTRPRRPLFLPIVFQLGAKVENLPLRAFLANPTKISNALRQIRGGVPGDGVTCYFDPYLEVEALGATLRWQSDDQPPLVCWPGPGLRGELPAGLRAPEDAVKSGRVEVAAEVIRRLNSLWRDGVLLMAGISGPFTLAARLIQLDQPELASAADFPASALGIAAALLVPLVTALLEAGAHVIFIHEDVLPRLSAENCESWSSLLSPAFNVVRFYGAVPVLLLANPGAAAQNLEVLGSRDWEGVLCVAADASSPAELSLPDPTRTGVALTSRWLASDESISDFAGRLRELRPAIITTAGDLPTSIDSRRLAAIYEEIRR